MKSPNVRAAIAAVLAALCAVASAPSRAMDFEITPFAGYRAGGAFHDTSIDENRDIDEAASFGIALNLRKDAETQWELTYSRQDTSIEPLAGATVPGALDLRVDYLQLGGTYFFSESDHQGFDPYVVGGLGITRFTPERAGLNDRIEPSLNVGIGMRVPVSKRVALRIEGRGYVTILDSSGSIFCRSDSVDAACTIHARARGLWQLEALFGVSFRL
jgi:opacity protein-like surface antigen